MLVVIDCIDSIDLLMIYHSPIHRGLIPQSHQSLLARLKSHSPPMQRYTYVMQHIIYLIITELDVEMETSGLNKKCVCFWFHPFKKLG